MIYPEGKARTNILLPNDTEWNPKYCNGQKRRFEKFLEREQKYGENKPFLIFELGTNKLPDRMASIRNRL